MADMHPEDIKAEVRKRGYSLAELADRNGLVRQSMSMAIRGRSSERAEQIIAEILDMKPQAIWPSRYRKDGKRIMLRRPTQRARQDRAKAGGSA